VREVTGGAGVPAVYDGVGAATFETSLRGTARRGIVVLFGAASGPVPPFDLQRLNPAGSLFVTRPTLGDSVASRAELDWRAGELFDLVLAGTLDVRVGATYPLEQVRQAHEDLEGRRTTGKVLLLPR
jgi:NADPH2:quinone reductase